MLRRPRRRDRLSAGRRRGLREDDAQRTAPGTHGDASQRQPHVRHADPADDPRGEQPQPARVSGPARALSVARRGAGRRRARSAPRAAPRPRRAVSLVALAAAQGDSAAARRPADGIRLCALGLRAGAHASFGARRGSPRVGAAQRRLALAQRRARWAGERRALRPTRSRGRAEARGHVRLRGARARGDRGVGRGPTCGSVLCDVRGAGGRVLPSEHALESPSGAPVRWSTRPATAACRGSRDGPSRACR